MIDLKRAPGPRWKPRLGQATASIAPIPPQPQTGVPTIVVDIGVLAVGAAVGLVGASNRNKSLGMLAMGVGGGIFGVGLVFTILDLFGIKRPSL